MERRGDSSHFKKSGFPSPRLFMKHKRKYIWAYLDGEKYVEVIQAALDNNMMVNDLKKKLVEGNPNHEVTFKVVYE